MNYDVYQRLSDSWGSELIARSEVKRFTGGMISPGYLANLDSRGEGPPGRIKIGGRVGYDKHQFIEWLRTRSGRPAVVA